MDIEGLQELIEDYVDKYPDLLYVMENGQFSVNKALPVYKSLLQSHMSLLHDRYLLTDRRPIYISPTCVVYKAVDYSVRDRQNKPIVIALKLMKYKSQYVKEIGMRKQMEMMGHRSGRVSNSAGNTGEEATFVVAVLSSHAPRNNKDSSDDSMDLYDLMNYSNCDTKEPIRRTERPISPPPVRPRDSNSTNNKAAKNSDNNSTIRLVDSRVARVNEDRRNRLQALNSLKYNAEKLYCIAMPLASTNLQSAVKQERYMAKNLLEIKGIFLQILRSVDFIHSKGLVHGKLIWDDILIFL